MMQWTLAPQYEQIDKDGWRYVTDRMNSSANLYYGKVKDAAGQEGRQGARAIGQLFEGNEIMIADPNPLMNMN